MLSNENLERRPRRTRRSVVAGVLGVALLGTTLIAASAEAAKVSFPRSFNPETAPGFTNTISETIGDLKPACPQAIAGTPGSEPATKVLNDALNTPESFTAGGTVHYIYDDNPHANGGTDNFTIQDCVVTYPAGTFQPSDFNSDGVLINAQKSVLNGGTQIDGGELSGISNKEGLIYYSWTSGSDLGDGTWVCNFARDIRNNHGGGGNRKVLPSCYQITPPDDPDPLFVPPSVEIAYADTFHVGNSGVLFTPTPWEGQVSYFAGCNPGSCGGDGKFDGGAIKLRNQDPNPMTLKSASVTIGACMFTPWGTFLPATPTAPGQEIILTQTGILGQPMPQPCAQHIAPQYWPQTNFDTSEPPGAIQCDPALGEVPVIHLEITDGLGNDVVLNLNDTTKLLNTGGVDAASCFGLSEAMAWQPLGSAHPLFP